MDVSEWTVADRIMLPDWCFPSRQVISARVSIFAADTFAWKMSEVALPDPCFLWQVGIFIRKSDHQSNYLRMGLLEDVPIDEAGMNDAWEILPDFGSTGYSPERIYLFVGGGVYLEPQVNKHLVTGGRQLVVEGHVHVGGTELCGMIHVVVSGLPTNVSNVFNHKIA